MNILIIGCGKVGSTLASTLSRIGHDVSVIDSDKESFELLADDFNGITVTGVPIDQDVLKKAGIEGCDAVAAVTKNDNINVMVCELAKEVFKVNKILARVYEPSREEIFENFGIHTFCPTNLTVESAISILTDRDQIKYVSFDSTSVAFSTAKVPKHLNGHSVNAVHIDTGEKLIGVIHEDGKLTLIGRNDDFVIYTSDRLVLAKTIN
ncbi:MAG: TrkA family potassium uptake protein [Oscillospiraceae bacterium]